MREKFSLSSKLFYEILPPFLSYTEHILRCTFQNLFMETIKIKAINYTEVYVTNEQNWSKHFHKLLVFYIQTLQ